MKMHYFILFTCLIPIVTFGQHSTQYQKIHQDSTPYKFEILLAPKMEESDQLFIYKEDSILVQTLRNFKRYADAYGGGREIIFQDINFDGYIDLKVWVIQPRRAQLELKDSTISFLDPAQHIIWLYQPEKGKYEYSEVLSKLPNFTLDPKKKRIIVAQYILHTHCQHSGDIFNLRWTENGNLKIHNIRHIDTRNHFPIPDHQ